MAAEMYKGIIQDDFKLVALDCTHCTATLNTKLARSSKNIAKVQRVKAAQVDAMSNRVSVTARYPPVLH